MKLHVINTGFFKLDGGAMFGVVPKSIWQKTNPADENNLCRWAMRLLLIEDGNRLILIDTGIGDKQDSKFLGHYHLHGTDSLTGSLNKAGFSFDDVTDVFLTHLHFDHCGGAIRYEDPAAKHTVPVFRNATYWSHSVHWEWAVNPNAREKASFLKENILPIQESGQLRFYDKDHDAFQVFDVLTVSGHTESMMIPKIRYKDNVICYMADLLPSVGHIPLPYVMAYDVRPLLTLEEKKSFLDEAVKNGYVLFFEHDPVHECCTLTHTDRGVRAEKTFALNEIL